MELLIKILWVVAGLMLAYHLISSTFMSREILVWVPNKKRKIKLLLLVWLIPFFGLRMVNRKAQLGLFEATNKSDSSSTTGMGLLEIEAIFNPGVKHRVAAVKEHKVQVQKKNSQQD